MVKLSTKEAAEEAAEEACRYAHYVGGRCPEVEEVISKYPHCAYWYAYNILRGRFPKGEENISKSSEYAYWYAYTIVKGRWPKGEEAIFSGRWATTYREEFVKKSNKSKKSKKSVTKLIKDGIVNANILMSAAIGKRLLDI